MFCAFFQLYISTNIYQRILHITEKLLQKNSGREKITVKFCVIRLNRKNFKPLIVQNAY